MKIESFELHKVTDDRFLLIGHATDLKQATITLDRKTLLKLCLRLTMEVSQ